MSSFKFVPLIALVCALGIPAMGEDHPPPPFLQGASEDVIADFHKVLQSSSAKTDEQIDTAVDEWVEKQGDDIKSKYTAFKAQMKDHHSAADAAHKAAIEKFSPEAKEADEKLSKVAADPTLTAEQKGKQIEKIVNGLDGKVRAEIEKAMKGSE